MSHLTPHIPLILATVLYVWQTILYVRQGEPAFALTFFAYALANIGLIWAAMRALSR